jgi:hypothetical protein
MPSIEEGLELHSISLEGVIDLHVHTAPDVRPRLMDDIELTREAANAGMRAVLLKSHHTITADRGSIAESYVGGIKVFGGLALNHAVGGLNPAAVETALSLGAREIWMPTLTANNHLRVKGEPGSGISILDVRGAVFPEVYEILDLLAEADVILGTGHLSVTEIMVLVSAAREAGIRRILITHPELPIVGMPVEIQHDLQGMGVFFERCLIAPVSYPDRVSMADIAQAVFRLGPESTVLATDFGQMNNPSPVQGMRQFIASLIKEGVPQKDIDRMTKVNPSMLLDLDD